MIAGFSALHTSAWIYTNKSDASIKWLETAFSTDPAHYYKRSFKNESMLSAAFSANGLQEYAIKWGKKAYSKYPNDPRTGYNYANQLITANRPEEGYAIMEQLLKSFPTYAMPYTTLITHYLDIKDYNALYRVLLQMEQFYAQSPEAFTSRLSSEQLKQYFDILSQMKSQYNQP
jgi:predicted Zn-dependent protease